MAQTSYNDLANFCTVELPGVSSPMLMSALNLAAIELCQKSLCWNEWQEYVTDDSTTTVAYGLDLPPNARLETVKQVLSNGNPMDVSSYCINEDGDLEFDAAIPSVTLQIQVVFAPTLTATVFDSRLMQRYGMALCHGAKASLMRMPGVSWSNPSLSDYYQRLFLQSVDNAVIDQNHRQLSGGSVRVTQFAFGSK